MLNVESQKTALFEPWLNFKTPIVRQLAFVVASPNIMLKAPNDLKIKHAFELHSDDFWHQHYANYQTRLFELDDNPDELINFVAQLKSTRLGLRFEYLMWFWLQDAKYHCFEIIGHSIQIIDGRNTVGELDFVLWNKTTQQIEHWEVALKFYLSEPSLNLLEWYGLNRSDTLFRKLNHFTEKQFQFNHVMIKQQNFTIDRKFAVLKGQLYLPIHSCHFERQKTSLKTYYVLPTWINSSRRIGRWGYNTQANFYRVERQEWICPKRHQSSANAVWWYDGLYRNSLTLEDFMFRQAEYIRSPVKIM